MCMLEYDTICIRYGDVLLQAPLTCGSDISLRALEHSWVGKVMESRFVKPLNVYLQVTRIGTHILKGADRYPKKRQNYGMRYFYLIILTRFHESDNVCRICPCLC